MKLLLILSLQCSLAVCYPPTEEEPVMNSGEYEISARTERMAAKFENEIRSGLLLKKTDDTLNAIIRLAVYKLKRTGHIAEGTQLLKEWENQWSGYLLNRGIGDHRPLSKWLAEKTAMLELTLGKQAMHLLRLDDLITINYALPVVIKCIDEVDVDEYARHFVHDEANGYRGLGPVVSYWTSFFACVGFTWGTGFLFCAPIAMGVEYLVDNFVAPKLNEPLWRRACHQSQYGY